MKRIISLIMIMLAVILTGCEFGLKNLADKLTAVPGASVTYDANGADRGSAPRDENKYKAGYLATVLDNTNNLERDNSYYFTGWNTSADGTGTTYTPGQTITMGNSDIILYARWRQGTFYTVTYSANGGQGSVPSGQTYYESGTTVYVKNSGTLYLNGYRFSGWNTNAGGTGTNYTAGDSFTITGNTTLYAKWEGGETYNVTYNANYPANAAGDMGGSVPVDDTYYTPGSAVNIQANTGNLYCQGYTFGGWISGTATYADADLPTEITMGNSNIVLKARWNTTSHGVTFIDGSTFYRLIDVDSPAYSLGSLMPADPVKWNYNFRGWFTAQNGGGTQYLADTEVTGDITLYSYWDGTVSFDKNSDEASGSMSSITIGYNNYALLPACAYFRLGWYFAGWRTIYGTTYADSSSYYMNTGNTTLSAQWGHMVHYNANNGSGVIPFDSVVYVPNNTVTVMGLSGSGLTGPNGGSFICWNTESDGTGTRYYKGDTFTMGYSDVLLYAQYNSSAYQLGDTGPGGGKIFYIAADYSAGWKYMEAGTSDLGNACLVVAEMNPEAVGQGYENTVHLYELDNHTPGSAVYLCRNYSSNGYNDWFLPSENELNAMYANRAYIGGTFASGYYWSSTTAYVSTYMGAYQYTYLITFSNGSYYMDTLAGHHYVRPVRRF